MFYMAKIIYIITGLILIFSVVVFYGYLTLEFNSKSSEINAAGIGSSPGLLFLFMIYSIPSAITVLFGYSYLLFGFERLARNKISDWSISSLLLGFLIILVSFIYFKSISGGGEGAILPGLIIFFLVGILWISSTVSLILGISIGKKAKI